MELFNIWIVDIFRVSLLEPLLLDLCYDLLVIKLIALQTQRVQG